MPDAAEDKKQIGLTDGGNEALSQLMNAGLFDSEYDGYKVSIAYSLAKGVDPAAAAGSGGPHKFQRGRWLHHLDNQIRDLISVLLPGVCRSALCDSRTPRGSRNPSAGGADRSQGKLGGYPRGSPAAAAIVEHI